MLGKLKSLVAISLLTSNPDFAICLWNVECERKDIFAIAAGG
jgi:hypothetical protein